jgi:hypothetical protein
MTFQKSLFLKMAFVGLGISMVAQVRAGGAHGDHGNINPKLICSPQISRLQPAQVYDMLTKAEGARQLNLPELQDFRWVDGHLFLTIARIGQAPQLFEVAFAEYKDGRCSGGLTTTYLFDQNYQANTQLTWVKGGDEYFDRDVSFFTLLNADTLPLGSVAYGIAIQAHQENVDHLEIHQSKVVLCKGHDPLYHPLNLARWDQCGW